MAARLLSGTLAPVFIDLETQSRCDLKTAGAREYLSHPSTRPLSLAALVDQTLVVWIPEGRAPAGYEPRPADIWPEGYGSEILDFDWHVQAGGESPAPLRDAVSAGRTFAAHNATGFDAEAYRLLVGGPQPCQWYDTLPRARAVGLPGALDDIGEALVGKGKSDVGVQSLRLLTKATCDRAKETVYPVCTPPLWDEVLRYNIADVLLLKRVYEEVAGRDEAELIDVDTRINRRGIAVDQRLLKALLGLWSDAEIWAERAIDRLTGGEIRNVRSGPQVRRWVEANGVKLDSLNRKELERFYEQPGEFLFSGQGDCDLTAARRVVEVLKLRQICCRAMRGKVERIESLLHAEPDNRLRNLLVYHGAHTGRWTGRGAQPQNLSRGVKLDLAAVEQALAADALTLDAVRAASPKSSIDDILASLVRPLFCAAPGKVLVSADYASVEARGIGWVADEQKLLDSFRSGADIYCDMASSIFGRQIVPNKKDQPPERHVGKECILGAGYSMGGQRFAMGCELKGIDLAAAGVTGKGCIDAYRQKYPAIPGVWRDYNWAALAACGGQTARAGKCIFYQRDKSMIVRLPSGRELVYRCARVEQCVPRYAVLLGLQIDPRPTVVYRHPRGYDVETYGGKLAENVVQAICRDLLATSLIECERQGLPIVLHVHDAISGEVEEAAGAESLATLLRIMQSPPAWASGFPVAAEGYVSRRYSK